MSFKGKDLVSMVAKPGAGSGSESFLVYEKAILMVCLGEKTDHSLLDA